MKVYGPTAGGVNSWPQAGHFTLVAPVAEVVAQPVRPINSIAVTIRVKMAFICSSLGLILMKL